MESQSRIKKAMMYGAYYGFSAIAVMLLFYLLDADPKSKIPSLVNYVLLILFIVLGIKSYRDEECGGYISYGKSVGTGILISVFGGILVSVFTIVLFTMIDPGMTERILDEARQGMIEQGFPDEKIEKGIEIAHKMMTPFFMFLLGILGSAITGVIFSLIVSVFVKKEQSPFES
jgi:hypothetical protein